jgi:hypothetical protein
MRDESKRPEENENYLIVNPTGAVPEREFSRYTSKN